MSGFYLYIINVLNSKKRSELLSNIHLPCLTMSKIRCDRVLLAIKVYWWYLY